jgi:hypothetical protein
MTLSDTETETIRQFVEHNPDATVTQVLGRFSCSPADRDAIEALLDGEETPSAHTEEGGAVDDETATEAADEETGLVDMHGMSKAEKAALARVDRGRGTPTTIEGWLPDSDDNPGFGNPFKLIEDGGEYTLEESITEYERVFEKVIHRSDEFRAAVEELRGETLGCWCVDSKDACHGEVIIDHLHGDNETPTETESAASRVSQPPTEHYRREGVSGVYTTLGECGGVGLAGGVADFTRWYRYERVSDGTEATARGRIMSLSKDLDELDGALDRTLYASTTYTPAEWLTSSWTATRGTGKDRVWRDDDGEWGNRAKPTPDYDEIAAQVLLVDIDLPDDLKAARHQGGSFPKETVERALSYTVARFASLVGDRERVFLLDSAGGIYVLLPPAVTAPIVEEFPEDSGALLDELTDRMNDWLEDIEAETKAEFPDIVREEKDDVLTFDDVNHKNRIYKAPLSIHKSHDAVVHPLDPCAPCYEQLPLADVTEEAIEEAREWSETFTADSETHREGVVSVVSSLWEDIEAEGGSWTDVLETWLDEQDEPNQRLDTPTPPRPSPDRDPDAAVTAYVQDVKDAVDDLDAKRVGTATIVDEWQDDKDDRSGSGLRSFYPTWDTNCNGHANIMNLSKGIWIDTGAGHKGGPAKMALIAAKNFPRRGGYAGGQDWWRGVRLLRERYGYDIPVYIPPVGSTHSHGTRDRSPLWALCDAAVGLGICRRSELVEKSGDNGEMYYDLPTSVYNATLDALDKADIEHGRDRRGNGESGKSARATLEEGADEDETETKKFAREVLIDLLSAE